MTRNLLASIALLTTALVPTTGHSRPNRGPSSEAISCATENGTCDFRGTTMVFYGAEGGWVSKPVNNGTSCSNGVFGDPLVGTVKSCYIEPSRTDGALICNKTVQLKSWKGDYLHRPDSDQGVTTWNTGTGNHWTVECLDNGGVQLKSWKGDYLHRPDSDQGVTTWNTGGGNVWSVVSEKGSLQLKSWKGDYLHRPDSDQGVTSWSTGGGNVWTVELVN
ncbi:MAG: hypothetical protein ACI8RZ_007591 [Myxococcota bacterium]|jgi:hypothetical protein